MPWPLFDVGTTGSIDVVRTNVSNVVVSGDGAIDATAGVINVLVIGKL